MKRTILLITILLLSGCTNAGRSQLFGYGSDFKVKLYSGGELVQEWQSKGKVLTEADSDGWYFMDAKTNKLIRVSGTVVVEQL